MKEMVSIAQYFPVGGEGCAAARMPTSRSPDSSAKRTMRRCGIARSDASIRDLARRACAAVAYSFAAAAPLT
jgi:hypothetical protein